MVDEEFYINLANRLDYNVDTGVFTWIDSPSKNTPSGSIAGTLSPSGYIMIRSTLDNFRSKCIRAHRLAYYVVYGELPNLIDHINRDKSDNRISNLRLATRALNSINRDPSANNTSGVSGVCFHKPSKRWRVRMRVDGVRKNYGSYKNKSDAIKKRREVELMRVNDELRKM